MLSYPLFKRRSWLFQGEMIEKRAPVLAVALFFSLLCRETHSIPIKGGRYGNRERRNDEDARFEAPRLGDNENIVLPKRLIEDDKDTPGYYSGVRKGDSEMIILPKRSMEDDKDAPGYAGPRTGDSEMIILPKRSMKDDKDVPGYAGPRKGDSEMIILPKRSMEDDKDVPGYAGPRTGDSEMIILPKRSMEDDKDAHRHGGIHYGDNEYLRNSMKSLKGMEKRVRVCSSNQMLKGMKCVWRNKSDKNEKRAFVPACAGRDSRYMGCGKK